MKKSDLKKPVFTTVNKTTGEQLPKIKTQLSAYLYEKDWERNLEPSKTVEGQTMTVLEMVQRHRKGLPIDQNKGALYQGEELLPNLDDMDEIDKAAYMDSVADYLVEVRARIDESAKTEEQKRFMAAVDAKVRERLSEINTDGTPAPSAGGDSK